MAARRRLSIRFVPSRVLLRQQRQQRIREDKIRHNRMVEEHARAARHFALHEVHALGALRLPCSLLDKAVLSKVDDGDLPDDDCKDRELQRYDPNPSRIHVQDIEVNQQYRQSHHDDNDSDDDVDVVPSWYLSDRQRFELIERQRDLEHDLELGHAAASRDAFSPRDLKPIIDADLVQRFEQDLSVARISAPYRAPSEAHDAGTTYRMACMLRALDEESRRIEETKRTEKQDQNPFKKRRGANT
ncbi:hypothetical protein EX895_004630 [Sporisorium graminicola]|uniref:Uncharacterized protein n=1 Tax=Sporisorium graminicola TaxID=280036 RepID=A0A4U7KQ32_9BASI|nr:hypothetical protein EX895_004630 [Sporisorium graminicola]TKY86481.1 hypothetical protein EX895_004630 [Sporisorium graminicola]